jgi:hypothetical protein
MRIKNNLLKPKPSGKLKLRRDGQLNNKHWMLNN